MGDNLGPLADMIEAQTGFRHTREELLTYPTQPRIKCNCDACGTCGRWFELLSPEEIEEWQLESYSNLMTNKTSVETDYDHLDVHVLSAGALSFGRKYSQENWLDALLRIASRAETGRGLVQPAPLPAKGQSSKLRRRESPQDTSNQSAFASPSILLPTLTDKLSHKSEHHVTKSENDHSQSHVHRSLKTKVKTRPVPIPLPSESGESSSSEPPAPHLPPTVLMTSTSKTIFARMLATDPTNRKSLHFDDLAAAMIDAGFVVKKCSRNAGSAVGFKETRTYAGTITFHRPHPDPHIDHEMLRTWGGRLHKNFRWELESIVER